MQAFKKYLVWPISTFAEIKIKIMLRYILTQGKVDCYLLIRKTLFEY